MRILGRAACRRPHHHHRHPRHGGGGARRAHHRDQRRRRSSPTAGKPKARPATATARLQPTTARRSREQLAGAARRFAKPSAWRCSRWRAPLRTFLTMLGIIIGIASVVSVVALGEGAQQQVLAQIIARSAPTPSTSIPARTSATCGRPRCQTLRAGRRRRAAHAELRRQRHAERCRPSSRCATATSRANAQVNGVGEQYFRVRGMKLAAKAALRRRRRVDRWHRSVVIDDNTRKQFFPRSARTRSARSSCSARCRAASSAWSQTQQRRLRQRQQPERLGALHHGDGPPARPAPTLAASPCASPTTLRMDAAEAGDHAIS